MKQKLLSLPALLRSRLLQVVDMIVPPRCPLCSQRTADHYLLCGRCFNDLALITDPVCDQCHLPFDVPMPAGSICGACLNDPPEFDKAISVARYGGASRDLVLRLKHGKQFSVAPLMGKLMAQALQQSLPGLLNDKNNLIVCAVPLHWKRLLSRRFNQSAMLARIVADQVNGDFIPDLLVRKRSTPSQGSLKRRERYRNVQGAFQVNKKQIPDRLKDKNIILVDDVYTTGATLTACLKQLKQYKTGKIYVITFARVVKNTIFKENNSINI